MKKERFLKYLILICSIMVSFFILANVKVSAIDYVINDKVSFNLEQVDSQDITKGYVILGASTTCEENDSDCIVDLEIPSVYVDGGAEYPIVEIKDSDNVSLGGVLQSLSKVVSGKVTIGSNIKKIGACAFCNFSNVTEYVIGESVANIGEYAFSNNASLKVIVKKEKDAGSGTQLANKNVFNASASLDKIVFINKGIAEGYGKLSVWKDIKSAGVSFTFKGIYRFYDENENLYETIELYNGETIGDRLPTAVVEKNGLNFNWKSSFDNHEVTSNSSAFYRDAVDGNGCSIHDVFPSWSLKQADLSFDISFGESVQSYEDNGTIDVVYGGKNKKMNIEAIVDHQLVGMENFVIEYSWYKIEGTKDETLYVNTSSINLFEVEESGTYKCIVIINYRGYEPIEQPISINVIIQPIKLTINVKDVEIEYGTFISDEIDVNGEHYDIDNSSLVEGERIKSVKFNGYNEESVVDIYPGVLTLDKNTLEIGYENDSENYVSNYKVTIVGGDLTVVPKSVKLELNSDIEIEYGEEEILTKDTIVTVFDEQISLVIEYFREDVDNKNVGKYEVVGAIVFNQGNVDNNYSVELSRTNTGKIVIVPRKVNVSWDVDENLVYSGVEKNVSASYKDINQNDIDLKVSITKNSSPAVLVNAGVYDLVATKYSNNDTNYELVGFEKEIEIEKADSEFIGEQRQTVTYNGLPQRVSVSLNHSEGTISYGEYNNCKNAHLSNDRVCEISVSVEETENYKAKSDVFQLHINPYIMEVIPDVFEFVYGTSIGQNNLNNTYEGVNGEKVVVYFSKSGVHSNLNVGYYDIASAYLSNTTNYEVMMVKNTGINKIKINPAPVEIRFYLYEGLVYDGTVKNIGIRIFGVDEGMEEDIGLVVDYGEKNIVKNAGDYRIDVSLTNSNFYIVGDNYLEFSVAKATYDVSNLKLTSEKKTFNFKSHFIKLEGDLPEGVIPVYTIDGENGNGTFLPFKHTVKVTFEGDFENYNYIEPLIATLNIDMAWVWITLALVVFVGVGVPLTFYLLVKYKVIRFRKRIKRNVVRKLIRRSRELDALNDMFRSLKEESLKEKEVEEEVVIIEEPVKFIKKPANTEPEVLIELSFIDELFKASYGTKQFYSEVKNELLSYDGIVSKIKRDYETFYLNNVPMAKLDVVDGVLYAYFALDPSMYKESEYKHVDVSKEKAFKSVPLKLKIDSIDSLRHAKMFVRIIRKKEGLKFISNFIRTDYVSVYTAKESSFKLFKKVFVKKGSKEELED